MKFIIICLCIAFAQGQTTDYSTYPPLHPKPNLRYKTPENRIVGGDIATRGQIPYQAAVVLDDTSLCGGSLITESVVLTAAICTFGTATFVIHLGAQEIFDTSEDGRVIVTTSDSLTYDDSMRHRAGFVEVDMAIIRLPEAVTLSQYIGLARLPSRSQVGLTFAGETGRASGWGYTSDAINDISPSLKFVDMPIMANDDCQVFWPPGVLTDNKFCVNTAGGQSVCLHDNGGPLAVTEADGEATQIGMMTSGSSAGCEIGYPALMIHLNFYLDWFETTAGATIRP